MDKKIPLIVGVIVCLACIGVSFFYLHKGDTLVFVVCLLVGVIFLANTIRKYIADCKKEKDEREKRQKDKKDKNDKI